MASKSELIEQAEKLGIKTEGLTVAELSNAIETAGGDGEKTGAPASEAGTSSRAEEKRARTAEGPIAKPKKKLTKPIIGDLYPWALNRAKAERAHTYITTNPDGLPELARLEPGTDEFEQAVMDQYTLHGGLVSGQEKVTLIGRKKSTDFEPGMTTSQVIAGKDASDEDDD